MKITNFIVSQIGETFFVCWQENNIRTILKYLGASTYSTILDKVEFLVCHNISQKKNPLQVY